ncbi:C40 family peptidase [Priestia megaterium]|uniref:C40 family peptidase n=1 Tax=Priestia megaterium TaxID=1404 RepID=UPI002A6B00AF|nr:C40 family peptidase [Priestia megaterium]MDY0943381.1 C40 family peptidase [Priestia megaterium]
MNIKLWLLTATTVILATFGVGAVPSVHASEEKETAYIDVAAATLWTAPNILREVDTPSATNPVDMKKWTTSMNLKQKQQLSSDGMLETQALYGNKVTVLEKQGDWVKVAVDGQPTSRNELGYPGWMPNKQLTYSKRYEQYAKKTFVMVTAPTTYLYHSPSLKKKGIEVSYNTRLPLLAKSKSAYKVLKPNGKTAWISAKAGKIYASQKDIPVPTGTELVESGKAFLNLPYLWAGMSGFGFDCSGFTFTMYQSHGITIPRDSGPQSRAGKPVEMNDLQPGDLLFFAYNQGKGSVHHVAMYAGDGMIIHSPNSERTVEIIPLNTKGYIEEYAGARRYLP